MRLTAVGISTVMSPISVASELEKNGVFSDADLEQTFGLTVKPIQLTVLSTQEMKETQRSTQGPAGAIEYTFHQQIGGNKFYSTDFIRDAGFGAAAGASRKISLTGINAFIA